MTDSATITDRELKALLDATLPHASGDYTLPMINAVNLNANGHWLTGAATDRYTLGVYRIRLAEPVTEPFNITIRKSDARRLATVFKPAAGHKDTVKLTLRPGDGTLVVQSENDDRISAAAVDGKFPDVQKLIAPALNRTETAKVTGGLALNPLFLSRWKNVGGRDEPIRLLFGDNRMVLVVVGRNFIGGWMQVVLANTKSSAESPAELWQDVFAVDSPPATAGAA